MSPAEFCYWLQGAIEIGALDSVDRQKALMIIERLRTVERHNVFTLSSLMMFVHYEPQSVFKEVRKSLQEMFIHDIDPSYEGDQEYFHDLHKGLKQSI